APAVHDEEAAGRYPERLMARIAELGILGALVSPEQGGLGLDLVTYAMAVEELARGWSTLAALVVAQATVSPLLERFGPRGEPDRRVSALTRGEIFGALARGGAALAHGGGALARGASVTGRTDGDGWVLEGRVTLVDNAERSRLFLVGARLDGRAACVVV